MIGIQPDAALCAAGRILKIPVYDLQHGIIDHSDNTQNYYGSRKGTALGQMGIPSNVICWNQASAKTIEDIWPISKTITAGNPWLMRFMYAEPTDRIVSYETEMIAKTLPG